MKIRNTILLTLSGLFFVALMSCDRSLENSDEKILSPENVVGNSNSASADNNKKLFPVIKFDKEEHNFGTIIQGEIVTYGFKFKNTGTKELLIYKVRTSCGCTVTDYPKTPISPGEGGVINVTFDSKGRKGFQRKTVSVVANTEPNITQIKIKSIITIPEY